METQQGKFITFEGGEGVGKSTQARLLCEKLNQFGIKNIKTREPGGSSVAEEIRKILKASSSRIDSICDAMLVFAARRDHFINLIKPALDQGIWVICDRFYDSSLVYQGILKSVPIENLMQLKYISIGDFEPDLTIILDMDTTTSADRVAKRNQTISHELDKYDLMPQTDYDIIRDGFLKIADTFSDRAKIIKASGSEHTIASKIFNLLQNFFNLKK